MSQMPQIRSLYRALFRRSANTCVSNLRFAVVWLGKIHNLHTDHVYQLSLKSGSDRLYVPWENPSCRMDFPHGSKPLTRSKISEISQWQKCFSELIISNLRISCTLNGVRRSSWKVVWVTISIYSSETSFRLQIFCSCSWQAIDTC